jgi:biotin operon repressor
MTTESQSATSPPSVTATVYRPVDWQRLALANTHPLRVSIMEVFGIDGGRRMSSTDLAYELQAPLANVNYHVNELAKHGLLVLSHRKRVRGATEHFYRLPGVDDGNGSRAKAGRGARRTNGSDKAATPARVK